LVTELYIYKEIVEKIFQNVHKCIYERITSPTYKLLSILKISSIYICNTRKL